MSGPLRRSFGRRSKASDAPRRQSRWTATPHPTAAVRELKVDGSLAADTKLRSSKYLNNLIEQDHRSVKQRIAVMLGFKGFRNAAITIAGIELMHRIRKGQFGLGRLVWGSKAEPCLRSGTRCLGPEVCTAQQGTLCSRFYLHHSLRDHAGSEQLPTSRFRVASTGLKLPTAA
jgi:DDE domain